MKRAKKLFLSTILGLCCLTTGCVAADGGGGDPVGPGPGPGPGPVNDDPYDYDYPYYITSAKVMESEDDEDPVGKRHLYVRSWDSKNTTQKDGYYSLQRAGEYAFNNFDQAFNPATKLLSCNPINEASVNDAKSALKAEFDQVFGNNEENDVSYVILSCNADGKGQLQLFDDYTTGGNKFIDIPTMFNWFKNYNGKFYVLISAPYVGQVFNPNYVYSYNFLDKLDGEKFTVITGPVDAGSSTYNNQFTYRPYSFVSTSDETISLPSDLASQFSVGVTKNPYGYFYADYDKDGNVTAEELFIYARTAYGPKGTYCEHFGPHIAEDVVISDYNLDLYSTTSGSLINEGQEKLSIKIPKNKIINSIGMPNIKEGYKFIGWSFDEEGTQKVTFPLKISANTEIFANFESKNGEKPGYVNAKQLDIVRIPYKEGSYNDFYILDFKANDGKPGMFLVSTGLAGMTKYPADGVTSNYYFTGTAAEAWCEEYMRRYFPDSLNSIISPSSAPLGSTDPTKQLENAKMFFLSRAEVEEYITPDILKLPEDYLLRSDNSTNNDQVKASGEFKLYHKSVTDVKGTRPAINLKISSEDLGYDAESKTFFIKSVGKYVKTAPQRYDGTYVKKVDGEVTYTATGNRKLACDYMNTLASSRWETNRPWTYKDGYNEWLFQPGKYRGTLYNTTNDDFYDYEHIEECFMKNTTQVHGLDCAASVSAAYTLTFGKRFLNSYKVAPEKELLYGCIQYACDTVDEGIGNIAEYAQKSNGVPVQIDHHDFVHIPGDPVMPKMPTDETSLFGYQLQENLLAAGTNIFEEVYANILPGDGIVSRGKTYKDNVPTGTVQGSTTHVRMIIGVDIIHDSNGHIDSAKSKIYYADTSTPKSGRFIYGGESTSYCNFDTYSSKKTNAVTFDELYHVGYMPFTLNNWEQGYTDSQLNDK